MTYTYQKRSGQGLRYDIFAGTELMAICWTKAHAEQICKALNGGAAHE
jgi:hypothetical protein